MSVAQAHRGPDDSGVFVLPDASGGLANTRLAIRDLSTHGHQPMRNTAETVWITYNGEIFNAEELRSELIRLGYRFRSRSDTEVVLHAYQAWGAQSVTRLRGMFAFAVLDLRDGNRTLLLARDPVGVKPLYYAVTADSFAFASEIKGIIQSGILSREIDRSALVGYLLLGSVPSALTIYRDARTLESGCTMTVDLSKLHRISTTVYWRAPENANASLEHIETPAEVLRLLAEAVASQMVSDVPVGAFLSGGLDSSTIVALMRKATASTIQTCSLSFEGTTTNEATLARAMAQSVGAEHVARTITAQDLVEQLDAILSAMDQPSVDAVNTYFVAQTAREANLTVALSGLEGDELFGGYQSMFQGVPRLVRAVGAVQRVPGGVALATVAIGASDRKLRWAKATDALHRTADAPSAYLARRGLFSPSEVVRLVGSETWRLAASEFQPLNYIARRSGTADGVGSHRSGQHNWISRAELGVYLGQQLLPDTDAMSMAHSVEVRVPMLDQRLVDYVLRLPEGVWSNGLAKRLLRDAVGDYLPVQIRAPRQKQGFTVPLDVWNRRTATRSRANYDA